MNIKSILKTIGMGLLSSTPLGVAAMPVINALLPDDKKLPATATGKEAEKVLAALPPEKQAEIELAEINLLVEEEQGRTERYKAMSQADGQETRAKIVMRAMNTLIGLSIIFVSAVAYVYITKGAATAFSIEMIGVYVAVTGTFAYVVRAYFGDLRTETKSRHETIDEKARPESFIASILKRQ